MAVDIVKKPITDLNTINPGAIYSPDILDPSFFYIVLASGSTDGMSGRDRKITIDDLKKSMGFSRSDEDPNRYNLDAMRINAQIYLTSQYLNVSTSASVSNYFRVDPGVVHTGSINVGYNSVDQNFDTDCYTRINEAGVIDIYGSSGDRTILFPNEIRLSKDDDFTQTMLSLQKDGIRLTGATDYNFSSTLRYNKPPKIEMRIRHEGTGAYLQHIEFGVRSGSRVNLNGTVDADGDTEAVVSPTCLFFRDFNSNPDGLGNIAPDSNYIVYHMNGIYSRFEDTLWRLNSEDLMKVDRSIGKLDPLADKMTWFHTGTPGSPTFRENMRLELNNLNSIDLISVSSITSSLGDTYTNYISNSEITLYASKGQNSTTTDAVINRRATLSRSWLCVSSSDTPSSPNRYARVEPAKLEFSDSLPASQAEQDTNPNHLGPKHNAIRFWFQLNKNDRSLELYGQRPNGFTIYTNPTTGVRTRVNVYRDEVLATFGGFDWWRAGLDGAAPQEGGELKTARSTIY